MGMYFECELKKIDIDEVLSNVRYIEPEDLVVLYREKIRRLEIRLRNSENINADLTKENEKLIASIDKLNKEKNKIDGNRSSMRFQFGILQERLTVAESSIKELMAENARYLQLNKDLKKQIGDYKGAYEKYINTVKKLQEQASLETQINILNVVSDGYKDDIGKLIHENEKLKTENKQLLNENKDLKESVKKLKEEREILSTKQVYFEDQINTLNATCEGYADNLNTYRKDVDQLTRENKKLIEERDALWDETQHLDKIYKQLLNEKKRLQENFEELKASSDLSMTVELAEMFEEFIAKNDKNRDDLSVKIDEFKEKYQFE